jgi:hypothetical protein
VTGCKLFPPQCSEASDVRCEDRNSNPKPTKHEGVLASALRSSEDIHIPVTVQKAVCWKDVLNSRIQVFCVVTRFRVYNFASDFVTNLLLPS